MVMFISDSESAQSAKLVCRDRKSLMEVPASKASRYHKKVVLMLFGQIFLRMTPTPIYRRSLHSVHCQKNRETMSSLSGAEPLGEKTDKAFPTSALAECPVLRKVLARIPRKAENGLGCGLEVYMEAGQYLTVIVRCISCSPSLSDNNFILHRWVS
jgi:hypothetical protein